MKTRKTGFSGAGIKISGLDLLTGEIIWTLDPTLESASTLSSDEGCKENCDEVIFARLLSIHSSSSHSQISLIVSTKSSTYTWDIDSSTGSKIRVSTPTITDSISKGPLVGILSLEKHVDTHKGNSHYMLVRGKGRYSYKFIMDKIFCFKCTSIHYFVHFFSSFPFSLLCLLPSFLPHSFATVCEHSCIHL